MQNVLASRRDGLIHCAVIADVMRVPQTNGPQVSVTLRVPADVKDRVAVIASQMGISQSAVWKILIAAHLRPALMGSDAVTASADTVRSLDVEGTRRADVSPSFVRS